MISQIIVTIDKIFGSSMIPAVRASHTTIKENSDICATVSHVIKLSLLQYPSFIISHMTMIGFHIRTNNENKMIGIMTDHILSNRICPHKYTKNNAKKKSLKGLSSENI